MRRMKGGDLYKPKSRLNIKKPNPIPKQSPKRKLSAPEYRQICINLFETAKTNGTNQCFFCGENMNKKEDSHHLKGRDGFLFVDPEWLVIAHNLCHFWKYHKYTIEQLMEEPWWQGYLTRLKQKDEGLWYKEQKKIEKSLDFLD